jgi:hypothetical protein
VQRFVKAGAIRHRVRQARGAGSRAPGATGASRERQLTAESRRARWCCRRLRRLTRRLLATMFFGTLALLAAPLLVPLPSGGGGIEVVFLSGFAGEFGARAVSMLFLWRFYSAVLLTILGAYLMVHSLGVKAARQLVTIGWAKPSKRKGDVADRTS